MLVLGTTSVFAQGTPGATAELKLASGQSVGTATFTERESGVHVLAQLHGLPPGQHGLHVHAVGACDPTDFTSAGGHFNPMTKQHGLENPQGWHAGDMPNLEVGADGTATFDAMLDGATLGSGANSLLDADGSAIVLHADRDDQKTDPSGNSGARIACGVIMKAGAQASAGSAPVAQPSPAAKPATTTAPAAQPSPAAKPAVQAPAAAKPSAAQAPAVQASPATAPAQAPRPAASPSALPRTGSAIPAVEAAVPAAIAGFSAIGAGLLLWRRRR
ncbi:MAG: superoxide dismutase family protein [Chloroflexi bacterium]|nr:superoxide dismutase family protein [Chloroflexota bacterium]